ncbi:MAG TPA: CBS domain-containing protein, partial [Actinomycetes bacterium]|nr:CBS domain-containing protein [Actinomycetes bacterium]
MTDVRDVMNGPVLTVEPDASAADAAQLMRDNDTGDVVITQDGRLTGIVTDRDLTVRLIAEGLDPFVSVSEVCSENPVTIS